MRVSQTTVTTAPKVDFVGAETQNPEVGGGIPATYVAVTRN